MLTAPKLGGGDKTHSIPCPETHLVEGSAPFRIHFKKGIGSRALLVGGLIGVERVMAMKEKLCTN